MKRDIVEGIKRKPHHIQLQIMFEEKGKKVEMPLL
jgi:hypothetical protein